jgi:LmbE family N-acetylglucosaminyl deacetylase
MKRRRFLANSFSMAGLITSGILLAEVPRAAGQPWRVLCTGAHPDDPESGCGGTLKMYSQQGHQVRVVYLTSGQAGIPGLSPMKAEKIRTAESREACRILGAEPQFAGQMDGDSQITKEREDAFTEVLSAFDPDIVFCQWPLDTHPDHQVAGSLTLRACLGKLPRAQLYFYEVYTGVQTLGFQPNIYSDITATRQDKKRSIFAHQSQHVEAWYPHHEMMEKFRGAECGVAAAEAFVRLARGVKLSEKAS